jgi:hypothetical protein
MKRLSVILASLSLAATAFATTYVRVEKDGSKTYSDRPLPGGQPVDVQPAQSYSAPSAPSSDPTAPREERLLRQTDTFTYKSCSLSPEQDATFTNPENVSVALTTDPEFRNGDVAAMTVDGQLVSPNLRSHVISPVNRGTHTAQVTVKDTFGRVLCTASTTFHVMRPSLKSPARR